MYAVSLSHNPIQISLEDSQSPLSASHRKSSTEGEKTVKRRQMTQLQIEYPDILDESSPECTGFTNSLRVAKNLRVPHELLWEFLTYHLRTTSLSKSHYSGERRWLVGHFSVGQISSAVRSFIKEFILCPTCDKPEIDLRVTQGKFRYRCRACGDSQKKTCSSEKIQAWILTHPQFFTPTRTQPRKRHHKPRPPPL
jgi:translation initiation factor 2 beta subunit (eIF-2beta)/eIF-5